MKKAESLPEKDKEIYPSVAVSKNLYKDFAEHYGIIKKKVKKEDKLHTVEEGYKSLEEKVDDVIAGGKNYKEAGKIIALGLALREVEQKGGGLQATWTEKSFKNIYNKYMADSAMDTIGQTMSGLGMQQRLKKDLQGKPDRVKGFIDLAQEQYKKILDDREKKKDKGKGKPKEKQGEIQKEIKGP